MTSVAIFSLSGLAIIVLMVTKWLEEKRNTHFFILKAISKGNIQTRKFYHLLVYFYDTGKEQILFVIKKQIPLHSKISFNKLLSFLKHGREKYFVSMRDSRLLKKSDGLSEFFKNMSSIEKGDGEINDDYKDNPQNDPKN